MPAADNLPPIFFYPRFHRIIMVPLIAVALHVQVGLVGGPGYLNIMVGTLISRFAISVFALPFLYGYLHWQNTKRGTEIENRPVLAILKQVAEIEKELSLAQQEIQRRRAAEKERDKVILELKKVLSEVNGALITAQTGQT